MENLKDLVSQAWFELLAHDGSQRVSSVRHAWMSRYSLVTWVPYAEFEDFDQLGVYLQELCGGEDSPFPRKLATGDIIHACRVFTEEGALKFACGCGVPYGTPYILVNQKEDGSLLRTADASAISTAGPDFVAVKLQHGYPPFRSL